MMHECKTKKGKLVELLINRSGRLFCCGCFNEVSDEEVEPKALAEINSKFRKR